MAILRMTREEYKKKYGINPSSLGGLSSTSVVEDEEPKRNLGQKIAGFFGMENLGRGIAATRDETTFKTISEVGKQETQSQQALIKQIRREKDEKKRQRLVDFLKRQYGTDYTPMTAEEINPDLGLSNREVIGSAVNTAAMFLPATKGTNLATRVGTGAGTGYAFDVGSKLQDTEKEIGKSFTPGVGTIIGATLPIIFSITGKLSPKKLEEMNLRMTPTEKQYMKKKGNDLVDWIAKQKLVGNPETRYQKISQLYDDMERKVTEAVKNSGFKIRKNKLIAMIQEIPEQFANDPTSYDDAVRATEKITKFLQKKAPQEISGEILNNYKRNLFKRAYSKNNTDVVNESFHAVASRINSLLRDNVKNLEPLNKVYGNIINARKILFKATTRPQLGLGGKFLSAVMGSSIGGAIGGPVGAGIGAIVGEKGAQEIVGTASRSALGAGLQGIDDVLTKIPIDKSGNLQISKKALIRLIQQVFGYE